MKTPVLLSCLALSVCITLIACGTADERPGPASVGPQLEKTALDPAILDQYPCPDAEATGGKVWVCHVPPGNPRNRHEICMARPALPAHLKPHGPNEVSDYLGSCF